MCLEIVINYSVGFQSHAATWVTAQSHAATWITAQTGFRQDSKSIRTFDTPVNIPIIQCNIRSQDTPCLSKLTKITDL